MRRLKRIEKSVSLLMTLLLLLITAPVHSVLAAMVGTEAILVNQDTQNARDRLRSFLDREAVQSQLTARGIDPAEAQARVDSLSDSEVMQISDKIDQLPAGGSFWGTVLYVAIMALSVSRSRFGRPLLSLSESDCSYFNAPAAFCFPSSSACSRGRHSRPLWKTIGARASHQINKRSPAIAEKITIIHSNATCGTCRISQRPPSTPTTTPGSKRKSTHKLS